MITRHVALVIALALPACGARTELTASAVPDARVAFDVVDAPDGRDVVDAADAPDVIDARDVFDAPATVDAPVIVDTPPAVDGSARCGDRVTDPGEQCDYGASNGRRLSLTLSQPGRPQVAIRPVVTRASVGQFYDYRSASAHTGYELPSTATLMLHVNTVDNQLSLVMVMGRDGNLGLSPAQPEADVEVLFTGLPQGSVRVVSDDDGELEFTSPTAARGRWRFDDNSDGCAIGSLTWSSSWRIVIEPTYRSGITAARFIDGAGTVRTLSLRESVVIEHRAGDRTCLDDCTLSRCGDGVVDADERCDDGNVQSGDGCAADCARIE